MTEHMPEGFLLNTPENIAKLSSKDAIYNCIKTGEIVEAPCIICDSKHNLIVDLGCMRGIIPREDGALGIAEGLTKDIALISRVNKPVCFTVKEITQDEFGNEYAVLSRKEAQTRCRDEFIRKLSAGDVISARVTHLEQFGCFVDIGCGIPSLIPIDLISVSRISHPSDRFSVGMDIKAVIKAFDGDRIFLSHKELLGTWEQNAVLFESGETVTGIARSIEEYGIFVELAPNLAGLAEPRTDISVNQHVSVYIKAIIPEKMKIKLIIVNTADRAIIHESKLNYFISSGHIDRWVYSTEGCPKMIETDFTLL
ncbi:MAG: S1 RNA-binding domain-containing protein [Oscillospiraceae bacterium]|nr:S1 RNA-binding domain-containing protein [Oscillospiraceae bacterium]